jgi:hypothetical protein
MDVRRAVMALCFVFAAASSHAQDGAALLPSRPLVSVAVQPLSETTEERVRIVQSWARAYADWERWDAQWRSRREPGWLSTRSRHEAPDPPAWLPDMCASTLPDGGPMVAGCAALRRWENDAAAVTMSQQIAQVRTAREQPEKTLWWQHIHLDALWPVTRAGSSAFGVAGVHATMKVTDRMSVFLAPGAMLMRLPGLNGESEWTTATDWGFSYRMFDFRLPGWHRPVSAHMNIARVWLLGGSSIHMPGEIYLAGLSLTFKSTPPSTKK